MRTRRDSVQTASTKTFRSSTLALLAMTAGIAAPASAGVTHAVTDTRQASCFDNSIEIACPTATQSFYGQDANYTSTQPKFTLSTDTLTVTDATTGLTWQSSPDTNGDGLLLANDKLNWTNAQALPAKLNSAKFGGYSDWRLPTIKELYSLMDFRGTDPSGMTGSDTSSLVPFIDTAFFDFEYGDTAAGERIIDSQYASSTLYVTKSATGSDLLFGVNFADGRIKGYELTMPDGSTKTFFVQCVRGNTTYDANTFVDNGNQTISDNATGLMWSKADSGSGMSWQSALTWVQTKNTAKFLGYSDWRLPDAKELQSILDYTRSPDKTSSAAINAVFSSTQITNEGGKADYPFYWTGTTHENTSQAPGGAAAYLSFGRALGWMKSPGASCYTLYDVHGAGAQRSDPKSGSASNYPLGTACTGGTAYGNGPQGDVIRVNNFVRLVRTSTSTGTTAPEIQVLSGTTDIVDGTGSVAYGSTVAGTAVVKTYTIKNTGTASLTLSTPTLPSGFTLASGFGTTSVAAGGSTTFSVSLSSSTAGSYSGKVSFANNDANENPFDFTVSGTVTAATPEIQVLSGTTDLVDGTSSVSFGTTRVGTPVSKSFTVKNTGTGSLTLGAITVSTGYKVSVGFGATTLAAGASTTFTVQLTASKAGSYSGKISFVNSDSNENPFDIKVAGAVGF